jgi:hypothetical protein
LSATAGALGGRLYCRRACTLSRGTLGPARRRLYCIADLMRAIGRARAWLWRQVGLVCELPAAPRWVPVLRVLPPGGPARRPGHRPNVHAHAWVGSRGVRRPPRPPLAHSRWRRRCAAQVILERPSLSVCVVGQPVHLGTHARVLPSVRSAKGLEAVVRLGQLVLGRREHDPEKAGARKALHTAPT